MADGTGPFEGWDTLEELDSHEGLSYEYWNAKYGPGPYKGWDTEKELRDHGGAWKAYWTGFVGRKPYDFGGWSSYEELNKHNGTPKKTVERVEQFKKDLEEKGEAYVREWYPDVHNLSDAKQMLDRGIIPDFLREMGYAATDEPEDPADYWKKASRQERLANRILEEPPPDKE